VADVGGHEEVVDIVQALRWLRSFSSSTSPFYFFFFFYCYGDHRDLHSFPTRRSSDLVEHHLFVAEIVLDQPERDAALVVEDVVRDRKSTRLNSSHVSISYAVFCLKKKKNKNKARLSALHEEMYCSDNCPSHTISHLP